VARSINDEAALGRNARLYLNRGVPKLIVEVDAVEGYEPTAAALDLLRTRLASVVDKPSGIQMLPTESFSEHHTSWDGADLRVAERRYRDRYSSSAAAVLYVIYVDGSYAASDDALGAAFNASSFAVFVQKIRQDATTPLVPSSAIERSVLVHETGHVLALVNLTYRSPRDHEDPQHEGHSRNPDSVMYWAIDNVGIASLLGGRTAPPTDFDSDDRADLADLRSGKLP
jgi:hypothetical protein